MGGWELDFEAWFDIPEIISRTIAQLAGSLLIWPHITGLLQYDERIQREIWDDNPNALIAAGNIYQQGSAKK